MANYTLTQLRNGELKGEVSIKLSEGLTHFPEELFELADTLEILDLSFNKLTTLPANFGRLYKLRIFFCSENLFTVLPEVLADCPLLDIVGFKANVIEFVPARSLHVNLRWLILTDNKIVSIPSEIGACKRMQKLMLAGNRLKNLPEELALCRNLCLLRISANQLTVLPDWLLSMPKLAWLAFSGNPLSVKPDLPALEPIDWSTIRMERVLGAGASGIISKATRIIWTGNEDVAVKIFKGEVTSDGFPADEMMAYIASGAHPGLVRLIGKITGHPENKDGVVMELIPEGFLNLGLPPSLESCTRDVFKEDMTLSIRQVLKVAATIASIGAQLHGKGIIHGDLYAHNTLIDNEGNTLFGDFGAASFYEPAKADAAFLLERIEVNAYGQLLDDLLSLCGEKESQEWVTLTALSSACIDPDVSSRPGFDELSEKISPLVF